MQNIINICAYITKIFKSVNSIDIFITIDKSRYIKNTGRYKYNGRQMIIYYFVQTVYKPIYIENTNNATDNVHVPLNGCNI